MAATHSVRITREKLSTWFDSKYDDGFAWNSNEGLILYQKLVSKKLLFFRNAESTYQELREKKGSKWRDARWQTSYREAPLTEVGKVQAAAVACRYVEPFKLITVAENQNDY